MARATRSPTASRVLLCERSLTDPHKTAQAREHDSPADPAREARRPQGTPWLHGWLLAERLRRSVDGLEPHLRGAVAVTACGGTGMDAEYLARLGAQVISTEISLSAARLAHERFARAGVPALSVVADAERLPLANRAVAVGYVLDGMHHLRDPLEGVRELLRVAASAVAVSEPAAAGLTRVAIRLGLAKDVEAAGNPVARIEPGDVEALLSAHGFGAVSTDRYAMHYDPEVGGLVRLLSRQRLRGTGAWITATIAAAGSGWGNKVAIRAVRTTDAPPTVASPAGS